MAARLVAGVDSSTQACKVVVRDAVSGRVVGRGRAPHPDGTEVDPVAWAAALHRAIAESGGWEQLSAVSIAGQQHGMVCLDSEGAVQRPALLWNDTRSADAAAELIAELGDGDIDRGRQRWAEAVGVVPVASITVSKLRWFAEHEPHLARHTASVCLPHDWLTWQLRADRGDAEVCTDRSDASGTGYWSARAGRYEPELVELALGHCPMLPRVATPAEAIGETPSGAVLGPGAGDNAAAALGLGAEPGDVIVSIGTSGVVSAVTVVPACDPAGIVAGFADATGRHLPLVCTLNAARVLDATAAMLGVGHDRLDELALQAPAGAEGLVMVPYLDGERTPDRPDATGALHGLQRTNATSAHLARAAVEGMLCGLADGLDAIRAHGVEVTRVLLIGGGAQSEAVRRLAPAVFGVPVDVPEPSEYVADGAARQAAWMMQDGAEPPHWDTPAPRRFEADPVPWVRDRYRQVRDLTARRPG